MARANKRIPSITEKDKSRFLEKVAKALTEQGCLEWTGNRTKQGYGKFSVGGGGFLAHRVSHFLSTGIDPCDLQVLHQCDNPKCVNFIHLFLGTNADNSHDMVRKGRAHRAIGDGNGSRIHPECLARGEDSGRAKLTEADVLMIRSDPRAQRVIASHYGVGQQVISKIKLRQIWAHVA